MIGTSKLWIMVSALAALCLGTAHASPLEAPLDWIDLESTEISLYDLKGLTEMQNAVLAHPTVASDFASNSPKGLKNIIEQNPHTIYAKCFKLAEIGKVIVCIFNNRKMMTDVAGRDFEISHGDRFVNIETDKEHLTSRWSDITDGVHLEPSKILDKWDLYLKSEKRIHDVSDHEADSQIASVELANLRLSNEQNFWRHFMVPMAQRGYEFINLAPHKIPRNYLAPLSHELYHSQLNRNDKYFDIAISFWLEHVSKSDASAMTDELGKKGYDINRGKTVIDEFQAYTLQLGAETTFLGPWTKKYRNALRKALIDGGINLIEIPDALTTGPEPKGPPKEPVRNGPKMADLKASPVLATLS